MQCPICNATFAPEKSDAKPFCSRRCQQIDLGRWLDEAYSMPTELDPDAIPPADDFDDDED
ncbi:MAG: DNA gyrase inhibitor YacG [Planctomycetales bacterium]|nr:DNA gyrase inhibitor YacG [Planctomycetales bacterium]